MNSAVPHPETPRTALRLDGTTQTSARSDTALLHDVGHHVHLLRDALQSEKQRLGLFLGAGCPLGIYDKDGKLSLKYIPDVAGLTAAVGAELSSESRFKDPWIKLTSACKTDSIPSPNVEHILTQLRTICSLKGTTRIDGMDVETLLRLDGRICESIATTVGKSLPAHTTSYHRLAAWISQIDRVNPVEVFTPNYDLLLEEALERVAGPFFDGFVGAREPFLDIAAMEQDAIPSRWARLWKLHGSVNWIRRKDGSVFRSAHPASPKEGQQLLIYPSHLKYEQSRRMPYLAMFDRLRAFLRATNSVLVVCGYSFTDDHINEVLLDGLRGNRSAHCFALMYPDVGGCGLVASHASRHANLTVLARDGALIGTRYGAYGPVDPSTIAPGAGFDAAAEGEIALGGSARAGRCLLGDFHHFALFLEAQFGARADDKRSEEVR
jgi:hypothetical protein